MVSEPALKVGDPVAVQRDFLLGKRHAAAGNWRAALNCFQLVTVHTPRTDETYNLYLSWEGLAMVQLHDPSGLNLCRRAALQETFHAEVFANLARAELKLQHRKAAYEAVRRGLRLAPNNEALWDLRHRMGMRRRPAIGFLSRDHILNRVLGRITYRPQRRARSARPAGRGGVV